MAGYVSPFDKWFRRVVRLSLVVLALPFVGMMVLVFRGGLKEQEALKRARAMPDAERRAIVAHCAKLSRDLKEDEYEVVYHQDLKGHYRAKPMPPEFAALQPVKVRVGKYSASIILQILVDSGVQISCSGFDTPTPSATISWGEGEGSETWVAPEAR